MTKLPSWLESLTDAELNRVFGAATVARGRQYATLGRVSSVKTVGELATASVRGSNYRTYHCTISPSATSGLLANCSCPMQRNCKHCVALLLTLTAPGAAPQTQGWQSVLAPFLPRADDGAPLALEVAEESGTLTVRLLRPGKRENWIRSGISWDDVTYPNNGLREAHRVALGALRAAEGLNGYARRETLSLGAMLPSGWHALAEAVAAGVTLLPGTTFTGRPLGRPRLLDRIEPLVRISRAGDGLTVRALTRIDGDVRALPAKAFLGRPAHGAWIAEGDDVLFGPLSRTLSPAAAGLFRHGELAIPADEVETFAAGYLPQLRRAVAVELDEGVDIPEPQPPQLLCRVDFGTRSASVHWGFRYRVGATVQDVGLAPQAGVARDRAAETRLAEAVPRGPWAEAGLTGVELRPAFLTGRPLITFVSEVLPELSDRDDVVLELDRDAPVFTQADDDPVVRLSVGEAEAGDWFDLHVEITVGEEKVPLADLLAALAAGDDHLMLDSGTWFSLDAPELAELRTLVEEAKLIVDVEGDTFRLRPEHAGLWEELVSLGVITEQAESWRSAVGALLDPASLPEVPVPAGLQAELRPYQATGFEWLSFLLASRLGGILADEMGLGKTVQALALALSARERGTLQGPVLVVAPTSVIGTWAAEAARFAPGLTTVTVTATETKRGASVASAVEGADLVVTSYTLLRLESDQYRALSWGAVLLDEAQFVKNHASKAYQAVRKLDAGVKIALTGTPLENNLMDLWSLLSITAPGLFPDPKAFTTAFRRPIEAGDTEALARLHRRIRPLILRRTKAAVAAELPEKQEQVVPVELSPAHRRLYDRHLARERQKVLGLLGDLGRNRITILRSLTLLRQLSLSPALIDATHPAASAKIDTLVEMLGEVIAEGHRALVFSQFTGFLGLVRDRLKEEGIRTEYLDGRTRDRAGAIDGFRGGDAPVFLISLKAGGFGLTLTEADYVFILDPWWNPAAESQAIDRTHRIGQDKPVNVYRLVATDTIEEKVVDLQAHKRHLFDSVVGTGSDTAAPLSADDIMGLLAP
ncbi:MAG: DEAD/DEAH box helicase [Arachnia sp.]